MMTQLELGRQCANLVFGGITAGNPFAVSSSIGLCPNSALFEISCNCCINLGKVAKMTPYYRYPTVFKIFVSRMGIGKLPLLGRSGLEASPASTTTHPGHGQAFSGRIQ